MLRKQQLKTDTRRCHTGAKEGFATQVVMSFPRPPKYAKDCSRREDIEEGAVFPSKDTAMLTYFGGTSSFQKQKIISFCYFRLCNLQLCITAGSSRKLIGIALLSAILIKMEVELSELHRKSLHLRITEKQRKAAAPFQLLDERVHSFLWVNVLQLKRLSLLEREAES